MEKAGKGLNSIHQRLDLVPWSVIKLQHNFLRLIGAWLLAIYVHSALQSWDLTRMQLRHAGGFSGASDEPLYIEVLPDAYLLGDTDAVCFDPLCRFRQVLRQIGRQISWIWLLKCGKTPSVQEETRS